MGNHMSRSATETSGADMNVQYAIEEQLLQNQPYVKALLDQKRVWKNQELLKFVDNYFDNTLKTMDFHAAALQQYLEASNNYRSRIHDALQKYEEDANGGGASFEGVRWDPLMAHRFFHDLELVYTQQLPLRETLRSFENDLDDKLDCIRTWTKVSAFVFTAAVVSVSVAAAAFARTPAAAAPAAAAPVLLSTAGGWMYSHLKKHESDVKKYKEIIGVMIVGAKITINDLSNIHVLARRLQFETESMSEMADEVAVRRKLVAFMQRFRELQGQAADFRWGIRWARAVILQSIIKNLD